MKSPLDIELRFLISPTLMRMAYQEINLGPHFLTAIPNMFELFHDGGPYRIETSPLICNASKNLMNNLTGS